jgi:hypothetical protein
MNCLYLFDRCRRDVLLILNYCLTRTYLYTGAAIDTLEGIMPYLPRFAIDFYSYAGT